MVHAMNILFLVEAKREGLELSWIRKRPAEKLSNGQKERVDQLLVGTLTWGLMLSTKITLDQEPSSLASTLIERKRKEIN